MIEVNTPLYWDTIYAKEDKDNFLRADINRYSTLCKYIKPHDVVLDFGCGTGEFLEFAQKQQPISSLTGIDYSGVAIELAKKRCPQATFIQANKIQGVGYDVIFMQHVLEHFSNPETYIEQAFQALTEEGTLILVFPTYDEPWYEHLQIWTLDNLRLFMKAQKKWKWFFIHRPDTGFRHKDGIPTEETIIICQKVKGTTSQKQDS